MSEDAELVSRIRGGDLNAFEALYNKYKRRLYQTALAITGDSGAAEEVLQDGFVRAYHAMDRVNAATSLAPWLYRIVVNLSYNWANRRRRWPLELDSLIDRLIAGPSASPEVSAEGSELRQIVWDAVSSLSFKHRSVVVLFYVQGLSLKETAYILDCPLGTVKSRLHYACQSLRSKLSEDRRLTGEVAYGTSWH
jgi:RNA polymerase sigma-70 factor (ECF subfamily)